MPVTDVQKDLDALTMTITAEFDAGAERLWQIWSDPRQLERWWGPPSHPATFTDHDLSPGGRAAYYMTGPDDEGNPKEEMPTSVATVTLTESDGRTTMAIQSRFSSREQLEQTIEMGGEQGMREALDQIDALVAA